MFCIQETGQKDDAQNKPWENLQETQGIDGKTYGKTRRLAGKWPWLHPLSDAQEKGWRNGGEQNFHL